MAIIFSRLHNRFCIVNNATKEIHVLPAKVKTYTAARKFAV